MCGIIGFIKNKNYELLLPEMLEIQAYRGEDSYGAVFVFDKKIKTIKSLNKDKFIKEFDKVAKDNYKFVIIHHRKASIGSINLKLAHPITKGHISIIHNGTKKSLYETYKSLADSDTEAIAVLAKHLGFKHQIFRVSIDGVGVVFGFDTKENKFFFHHDGKRSLFINESKDLISSEPVLSGKWELIKGKHQFTFKTWKYLVNNLKTYERSIKVKENEYLLPEYCTTCKTTHLHNDQDQCLICKAKGIKTPPYNYYDNYIYSYKSNTIYSSKNEEYVFVYGTLKESYGNHRVMKEAGGVKICNAKTKEKYVMGGDGIPYVVKQGKPKHYIKGELYKVKNLYPLDQLEGHPTFYKREKVEVVCKNGKIVNAWMYFYTGDIKPNKEWIVNNEYYEFPKDIYNWYLDDDDLYNNTYQECVICGATEKLTYLDDEDVYICENCLEYYLNEK